MPTDQITEEEVLEVTPVSEWGKAAEVPEEGMPVKLPSGNVCRIRRTMDMMTMLQAGKIPNPLAKIINEMIESGGSDFTKAAQEAEDPEAVRQLFDMLNQTIAKAFVEPKVSSPPSREKGEPWVEYLARIALPVREEGETKAAFDKRYWKSWHKKGTLCANDIDMQDKLYVFAVAQGAAADLARFREESESAMGALQASKPVVKPTKRTGGGGRKK